MDRPESRVTPRHRARERRWPGNHQNSRGATDGGHNPINRRGARNRAARRREAGIHAPHSGDGGGTVVDDRQLAAIRRAASKIAEQLARRLARLLSVLSPRLWDWMISIRRISRTYHARHGFYPSLIHPVRYTEKVQWRKLFDLNSTYSVLCDKIDSRDFIRERIGPEVW